MARYVHGTRGFSYRYFTEQPDNLGALADWSGISQPAPRLGLHTQLYAFERDDYPATMRFVNGVSWLTRVYESPCPPFDLGPDVEGAIDQVADRWADAVRAIDDHLPGPAISPDIGGLSGGFTFTRDDWPALAAELDADPGAPDSIEAAKVALFESGADEYLPVLAANALQHAIRNDLATMELHGESWQTTTNLWAVVAEGAGPYDPGANWDERAAYARLLTFQRRTKDADPILRQLLTERPAALRPARALIGGFVWDERWDEIHAVADQALTGGRCDDAVRAELLCWRGEAARNLDRTADAQRDATAAADLGRPELLAALGPNMAS